MNDFTTGLVDNKNIFKEENGTVYVLISYPVPGFKPADAKFADTCEHRHNSNAEGQYWFCADIKGSGSQCTPTMLKPNTEVMRPQDAPTEPSDKEEGSCLKTVFQIDQAHFVDGKLTVDNAKMYTLLHNSVKFWGLQFTTADGGTGDSSPSAATEISHALKLASFTTDTAAGIPTPANSNCTAISWDPYGRVIDSLTLEPIPDVVVSLKKANNNNVLELVRNLENPVFRNPFYTNRQGGFNFAVKPGTYYLYPEHPNFRFPADSTLLSTAINNLNIFDPSQLYIERTKAHGQLYSNPQQGITEEAGVVERRDIIMEPVDPTYQGWTPEFISVQTSRQGTRQLISGLVSHPQSIIHALINNQEIARTTANMDGEFSLTLPENKIVPDANDFQLTVEKVPLVNGGKSATSTKSNFNLLPAALAGFIFNPDLQTVPNAKVDVIVSSFTNIPYTTVFADSRGFISLPHQSLPVEDFYLQIQPPSSSNVPSYKLTIEQFKRLNKVYFTKTGVNLYNPAIATEKLVEPGDEVVQAVVSQTPLALKNSNPFPRVERQPTTIPTPAPAPADPVLNWLVAGALLLALMLLLIAFFLKRKHANPYPPIT